MREGIQILLGKNKLAGDSESAVSPTSTSVETQKQNQADYYDEADPEFETTRPHGTPRFYEWLLREKFRRSIAGLPQVRGKSVLVVCAGSGMDAEFLADAGALVVASDISWGAAKRTADRAKRFGVRLTPVVADVEALPFPDCSFDYVYVHDGLHHLVDPSIGILEMARVARVGVSITEPYDAAVTAVLVRLGLSEAVEEAGNRVARLREESIMSCLRSVGLNPTSVSRYAMYYKHHPGPVMQFLSRRGLYEAARLGWHLGNAVLGRVGNKTTVQAIRTRVW